MNPDKELDGLTGELADDGEYIKIHHYKMLRKILQKFEGIRLQISIKPYREDASTAQFRYLHGVVLPCIRSWFRNEQGIELTADEVYAWVKVKLLGVKPIQKTIMGESVLILRELSFRKMKTDEFAMYTDMIIKEMALKGCDIPAPRGQNNLHEFG